MKNFIVETSAYTIQYTPGFNTAYTGTAVVPLMERTDYIDERIGMHLIIWTIK